MTLFFLKIIRYFFRDKQIPATFEVAGRRGGGSGKLSWKNLKYKLINFFRTIFHIFPMSK